jgi:hypothetical protein
VDPAKLAHELFPIVSHEAPPRRFVADADAIATAAEKTAELRAPLGTHRDLWTSLRC